jgi:hypothetical protein
VVVAGAVAEAMAGVIVAVAFICAFTPRFAAELFGPQLFMVYRFTRLTGPTGSFGHRRAPVSDPVALSCRPTLVMRSAWVGR